MRKITKINDGWHFIRDCADPLATVGEVSVDLPHTWNAQDGQDGGNDYFRGSYLYTKKINKEALGEGLHYLEIRGANSSADVYLNGKHLCHHDGGYSTFRVNLSDSLTEGDNALAIVVNNAPNDAVYPQVADFTFYGGLYRDVYIVSVNETHFDLDYYGSEGIKITPIINGADATVGVEVYSTELKSGQAYIYTLYDNEENELQKIASTEKKVNFEIKNVHLWHGRRDPYLYYCKCEIIENKEILDNISSRFGCRSFKIDAERGFILNGEEYPLRGVCRHQDREGIGNALLPEHHKEDMELIAELGANTIRLAHYQHDQYFYDLCDEYGMVIWAEIPYISEHSPQGRENTVNQMKELIVQNYNHPSIAVWGISNEITISDSSDDLLENHRILNDLCHEMDKTRLTALAAVSMCKTDDPYIMIPDVLSYNHYFGWYGGEVDMNGPWFDKFHEINPSIPIGCSEYGCEALNWHTSEPKQGDYTEEYQAYYHEELIKQLFTRKYIWATHVWNMFDFGADARAEGGVCGRNNKGLVTFDRKYKKDAFYAYKAWLSDESFVHICGKRYVDRAEDVTKITVYSNQPEVELFVNGKSVGKKHSEEHFFCFYAPNVGVSTVIAKAGKYTDKCKLRKVDKINPDYVLKDKSMVLNWFDIDAPAGRFSLNDKLGNIMDTPLGKRWFEKFAGLIKQKTDESNNDENKSGSLTVDLTSEESCGLVELMRGFPVLRLTSMMGSFMIDASFAKEELLLMNEELNLIPKPVT